MTAVGFLVLVEEDLDPAFSADGIGKHGEMDDSVD